MPIGAVGLGGQLPGLADGRAGIGRAAGAGIDHAQPDQAVAEPEAVPGPAPGGHRLLGPGRRRSPARGQVQELLEPQPALGQVPALLPEPPQRPRRLLGPAGLAGVGGPAQGQAQVGLLQLAAVQPLALVGAGEVGLGGHGQLQEVLGVAPPDRLQVAGGLEPLPPELADRLQHGEAGLPGGRPGPQHQRLVDQGGQPVQDVQPEPAGVAHRLGRLQRPAAGEHQQPPLGVQEQVVAPGDGPAQGPLPVRQGPGPAGEQAEAPLEPGQDLGGGQDLDAGGGQLDGQG
jgi:hypothetical protein